MLSRVKQKFKFPLLMFLIIGYHLSQLALSDCGANIFESNNFCFKRLEIFFKFED